MNCLEILVGCQLWSGIEEGMNSGKPQVLRLPFEQKLCSEEECRRVDALLKPRVAPLRAVRTIVSSPWPWLLCLRGFHNKYMVAATRLFNSSVEGRNKYFPYEQASKIIQVEELGEQGLWGRLFIIYRVVVRNYNYETVCSLSYYKAMYSLDEYISTSF